jgi:hypothetical protein
MSLTFKNTAFQVGGYRDLHWVEADEAKELNGAFRDANNYLEDRGPSSLARIDGYYLDQEFPDQTAVPAVFAVVIGENEAGAEFIYYAAMHDPWDNEGSGIVDDSEVYEDPAEAARAAHGIAERYAEHESEHQARFREYQDAYDALAEAIETIREARSEHSAFIGAVTKYADGRCDNAIYVGKRKAAREDVARAVKIIREARATLARPDLQEFK